MSKIYLANQFSLIDATRRYAETLRQDGHIVTSSWLNEPNNDGDTLKSLHPEYLGLCAKVDLYDIDFADVFVIFTVDPDVRTRRGGRHFETGYALARDKRMIACGPRENIFHFLPRFEVVETFDQLRGLLG